MTAERALEFLAHILDLGNVKRQSRLPGGCLDVGNLEKAAMAADNGRDLFQERPFRGDRHTNALAGGGSQKFELAVDGILAAFAFYGFGIGLVDPAQLAIGITQPDRHVDDIKHVLEKIDGDQQPIALVAQFRQFRSQVGQRHKTDEGAAASDTALGFQDLAGIGFQREIKALGIGTQLFGGTFERPRRCRTQPPGIGEETVDIVGCPYFRRQRAEDFGRHAHAFPDDDAAVAIDDERLVAGSAGIRIGKRGAQLPVFGVGAATLPDQPDRRDHGGGYRADHHREIDDVERGEGEFGDFLGRKCGCGNNHGQCDAGRQPAAQPFQPHRIPGAAGRLVICPARLQFRRHRFWSPAGRCARRPGHVHEGRVQSRANHRPKNIPVCRITVKTKCAKKKCAPFCQERAHKM